MKAFRYSPLVLAGCLLLASCLKKDYDLPPDTSGYDPMLKTNATLDSVLKYFDSNGDTTLIKDDWTIAAVIAADDRSGNLYKQLIIQDSTAGLAINIDANSLYANYPVGRKIYLKTKGLVLGNNAGTPVLGAAASETLSILGIAGTDVQNHIVKANTGNAVKDTVLTLEQARTYTASTEFKLLNRLVTIDGVQWADTSRTYTEPSDATSRYILDCGVNTYVGNRAPTGAMAVRTSNFAKFRSLKLPIGKGRIRGIFTVYNGSPQLLIRDTSDVQFYGQRCDPDALQPNEILKQLFSGGVSGAVNLAGWTNFAEAGGKSWEYGNAGSASNRPYTQLSAYQSGQSNVVSWLVTPQVSLTGAVNPKLSFISAKGFDNGAAFTLYASTNFTGDPLKATWKQLTFTLPSGSANFEWTPSGNVSLNEFISAGKVWIAWKYEGSDPNRTTTWELDNILISKD